LPTYLFQDVAKKASAASINMRENSRKAIEWFRQMSYSIVKTEPQQMIETAGPFEKVVKLSPNSIGKMYFFLYDAKHKKTLPYWDKYPLIFPIEFYPERGAMLGINLHYLYPYHRAKLMDALWTLANNDKYDKTTKLIVTYRTLKGASQFSLFKPCVKEYLFDHVKSPFIYIKPDMWDFAMMLPLARFQKQSQYAVWMDSSRIARGQKPVHSRKKKKK
jgi:hypothetical protein